MINNTVDTNKSADVQTTVAHAHEYNSSSAGACFKEKPFTASILFLVKSYFAVIFGICMAVAFVVSGAYNVVAKLVLKIASLAQGSDGRNYGIEQEDSVCY